MKKNKTVGLTLASLVSIIFFGYSFLFFIFFFPVKGYPFYVIYQYLCYVIISFCGFVASIFILDLRTWARKLIILSCSIFLGVALFTNLIYLFAYKLSIFNIKEFLLYAFWAAILFFLTRPKIKQQFKWSYYPFYIITKLTIYNYG